MSELLNVNMESSEINEEWVRKHFNLSKERKTTERSTGKTFDIDDQPFGYASVPYERFFDILQNQVDARVLHLIVKNNITCAEKFIKINLEMSTANWYGDSDPAIYIDIAWRQRETNAEVIKRLITSNKRALTTLKRKSKAQNKMADKIKNMSKEEREALKRLL